MQEVILKCLDGVVVEAMYNEHGNHVVQRVVELADQKRVSKLILSQCKTRVVALCRDLRGCRVILRLLERFERSQLKFVFDEIQKDLRDLTADEFGNYVITHVIMHGEIGDRCGIIDTILDDLTMLSLHKSGSNVVEKCLQYAPPDK